MKRRSFVAVPPGLSGLALWLVLASPAAAQPARQSIEPGGARLPPRPASWSALTLRGPAGITAAARGASDEALLFSANQWVSYRPSADTTEASGGVVAWDGWPASWSEGPDAAVRWDDRLLLLFSGPTYVWYSLEDQAVLGSPESLAGWELPWRRVDAAERWDDSSLLLFHQGEVALFDHETGEVDGPHRVADWLDMWPPAWFDGVHSALDMGDGWIYLFAHGGYLVLDRETETLVTPYPIPTSVRQSSQQEERP